MSYAALAQTQELDVLVDADAQDCRQSAMEVKLRELCHAAEGLDGQAFIDVPVKVVDHPLKAMSLI